MADEIIKLAKDAVRAWVIDGHRLEVPNELPPKLTNRKRGAFVSLKKNGDLRGCIGTYEPATDSIAEEVVRNAIRAAKEDPRFPPVNRSELETIYVTVDILSKPEPCERDDLDPDRFGVLVSQGGHRGLLLPDLEGVDTASKQLEIAKRKAGITRDRSYELKRFEVERHEAETPISP